MVEHASFDVIFMEDGNYLWLKWKGPQTHATIQAGCNHVLRLIGELGVSKIMNDGRYSVGCWTKSLPWIVFHYLPRVRRAGMRQAAHVIAYDRASKLSADSFRLIADLCHWNIEFFRTVEQAGEWLRQTTFTDE
ncbi:MAG TPA: hypothetical protein VGE12_04420 [Noviherbaspirillum sp.]